ncbi:hypothetical protein [Cohnella sp. GbtcB17]|uniref:hypothetical protein n=1 Tax=Cohnella sp. GbtcB17 TaxID=2824762 RepID=UPI001C2F83E4|nr:hypothetical protein [Cohnella sp. GbtcB17]
MKKKNRLKKWLIGIGCFLVLLLAGAYFGINYAADKVMDKLSDSILESAISSPISTNVDAGEPSSSAPATSASSSAPAQDTQQVNADQPDSNGTDKAGTGKASSSSATKTNSDDTSSESSSKEPDFSYSAEVSIDKAVAVKEDITFAEKTKLMTIMLKRLNATDIKALSDLAGGGLSVEKKKEAKKLILEKLSENEYDELIKIAQKYGLSQGKSYEDSKQEKGMQQ